MKLLIIRHGDPDYANDTLTERGVAEATALNPRMKKINPDHVYVSPLGRAKKTAELALEGLGKNTVTLPWLREFEGRCVKPGKETEGICWDWYPADWTVRPLFYDKDLWVTDPVFDGTNVPGEYEKVRAGLDSLLASHGYERNGNIYRAVAPTNDTVALFCHFALQCFMLSHLLGCSPMVLLHGLVAAPTSVTTLYTEERREGEASFRMGAYGDVSHLYAAGIEPSFSARFCECFKNDYERH
ncbi:MAG: histidine phosphatase family protein [Clostridia bacterium]|nr:histidine phosphatase family protein [Clostridia bacterium]